MRQKAARQGLRMAKAARVLLTGKDLTVFFMGGDDAEIR
jgi:hypothetical protein